MHKLCELVEDELNDLEEEAKRAISNKLFLIRTASYVCGAVWPFIKAITKLDVNTKADGVEKTISELYVTLRAFKFLVIRRGSQITDASPGKILVEGGLVKLEAEVKQLKEILEGHLYSLKENPKLEAVGCRVINAEIGGAEDFSIGAVEEQSKWLDAPWALDPTEFTVIREMSIVSDGFWKMSHFLYKREVKVAFRVLSDETQVISRGAVLKEADMQFRLLHPNVIMFIGVTLKREDNGEHVYIFIMEPFSETLCQYVDSGGVTSMRNKQEMVRQIVEGLAYLHIQYLVHGRIFPDSIVVDSRGVPKYTNFDFGDLDIDEPELSDEGKAWAAPERLQGGPPTTTSDVFSMGLISAYVLTSQRPPRESENVMQLMKIHYGDDFLSDLIKQCVLPIALKRPAAPELAWTLGSHWKSMGDNSGEC